ncbi:iron-sulfur cluster carrier protein MrpORP [Oleidesulfovibrio alaskensis]|jgi:Mrp family chromosome partitioning ATPase/predicted Fe-Mo cluster-binding NifX family protein|uniref:iron-sulfur cluster carrier protein MrpORP n=1 Tax=Oleidesulfovibrio alaskensis TaxID=58180 RepID=UPI001A3AA5E4|nr:iron-sulfur cluster carrier protein MrpORP [Oleidesulfovibrio alaskensis]MBL3581482.1 P-loop NTPase [Oleidesulfovibrio alaskensis]
MSESCGCSAGGNCSSGGCHENKSPEDLRLESSVSRIRNKVVVMSGKGGVGKSTIAANIAVSLALAGQKVGLLDVDVHGPSIPRLLGLDKTEIRMEERSLLPVPWNANLSVMSVGFMIPDPQQAVIWRGPVKMGFIKQMLSEVAWGDLDFLVVDCPPGTGDEPLSVLQLLGTDARAVIVTTPQAVAVDDVRRSIGFCRELGNPIAGVVENMSGFACPQCDHVEPLFGQGGGEALAKETNVPFLGAVPATSLMSRCGDKGLVFVQAQPENPVAEAIGRIVKPLLAHAGTLHEREGAVPAPQAEGTVKVALPLANGSLCQHFGHCEQFAIVTADTTAKTVLGTENITPPPHEPGVLPRFLAEQGVNVVLAGGMGARAQSLFTGQGINVVTGISGGSPHEVVSAWMQGSLTAGANTCDH